MGKEEVEGGREGRKGGGEKRKREKTDASFDSFQPSTSSSTTSRSMDLVRRTRRPSFTRRSCVVSFVVSIFREKGRNETKTDFRLRSSSLCSFSFSSRHLGKELGRHYSRGEMSVRQQMPICSWERRVEAGREASEGTSEPLSLSRFETKFEDTELTRRGFVFRFHYSTRLRSVRRSGCLGSARMGGGEFEEERRGEGREGGRKTRR